ncbi:hypothetical protein SDC9_86589 [bioreactor metagenome]|uniref:Uncharacterized protein n=1 Tax=bioreactor metagenome TaxID=1076179 RepID=A0A644ZML9_9ZZZZ
MQLFQIQIIAGYLIKFGHYRHHHIQTVRPPPVVIPVGTHLILHDFACTRYLLRIRRKHVQIGVVLKANLIIAEKNVLIRFTITIFPFVFII